MNSKMNNRILSVIIAIALVFTLCACAKKDDAPITSNWKYVSEEGNVDDEPVFVCDEDLNIALYLNGKVHYGMATLQDDGTYRVEYNDSDNYMIATITGDTMVLAVQNNTDLKMEFEVTEEQTIIPVVEN